ncbi:MAG: ABC transporter ATP-binding protein/permease [Malacoplasma sp.]|nr:ABC transporter ATP-binding protein/permease [Malacoplasma sp.]
MNSVSKMQTSHLKHGTQSRKGNFLIAFKLMYKYVNYYKVFFWTSIICSLFSVAFNITVIIGMGDLTALLTKLLYKQIDAPYFLIFGGILILLYFGYSLFYYISNVFIVFVSQKLGYKMRMDLFNKVQMLSVKYFDSHESGDIMSILTNDVYNMVMFISQNLGQIVSGFVTMIGMLILMFLINPYLSLIVIGAILISWIFVTILAKKSGPAFMKQQIQLGHMNGYIEEMISGQSIVTLYSQEEMVRNAFSSINKSLTKESEDAQSISGIMIPWMSFTMNFVVALVMGVGFTFAIKDIGFGLTSISNVSLIPSEGQVVFQASSLLTSFMLAARNFVQPINQIIQMIASIQSATAGSDRVMKIFQVENEEKPNETIEIGTLKGKVDIKNLNFSYNPNKPVLKNVNILAEPGQTVAIVGPTGSGKTTIINLLTKFYDITDGDIILDNKYNIKTVKKESIRNQVSIVLQDTYLFNGTIKENIRYAKKDATDEEIYSVAKTADCHNFIMKLEHGYDTVLTENAQELSTGQKQLLAIARAMLSPSSILILDEATSNIDTRTERVVQSAMLKLIKNKTSFVIAHRLSTIRSADKIVVLKDGSVLETGNHQQLMKKKGFYWKLNQSKTDNLDEEE